MKSFDDILKEGKQKATAKSSDAKKWRVAINTLMNALHDLNSMYGKDRLHNVKIETNSCSRCKAASFIVAVRDIKNLKRLVRYHKAQWSIVEGKTYLCEKCRKVK